MQESYAAARAHPGTGRALPGNPPSAKCNILCETRILAANLKDAWSFRANEASELQHDPCLARFRMKPHTLNQLAIPTAFLEQAAPR